MSLLDQIVEIFPNARDALKSQCEIYEVEDFPQLESLLSHTSPRSGTHRYWRKAASRLLDCIFASFLQVKRDGRLISGSNDGQRAETDDKLRDEGLQV